MPKFSPGAVLQENFSEETSVAATSSQDSACGKPRAALENPNSEQDRFECRNTVCLGIIFAVYFAFRSGTVVVLPLCSKALLSDFTKDSPHSPLYELPLAVWFGMDIILATPNAYIMRRFGRSPAFVFGGCCAIVASIAVFLVLQFCRNPVVTFVLMNIAVAFMAQVGMAEFVRFAAAEACRDAGRRARTVSRVVGFGACLSMAGPASASLSSYLAEVSHQNDVVGYSYFFLFSAGLGGCLVGASLLLRLPPVVIDPNAEVGTVWKILRRAPVWTSIVAQVSVQFAMVAPMSGIPIAMTDSMSELHAADVRISGCVAVHVLCMFLPGFWAGDAIAAVGELKVICVGLGVETVGLAVALAGDRLLHFYAGLALVGVGWNLAFVSSTMLLLGSHSLAERPLVTSVNETLRFAANACAVILSSTLTWTNVLLASAAALSLAFCALILRTRMTLSQRF